MQKLLLIISFLLFNFLVINAQDNTDCTDPYNSALEASEKIKLMLVKFRKSTLPYTENSFKDYKKFDTYIDCAIKNQGEDSEDAKKIRALKQEMYDMIYQTKDNAKLLNSDSAKAEISKKELYEKAGKTSCPADNYKGSDKSALKSKIINEWANDDMCGKDYKILKVYITGEDWEKAQGYDYSRSQDSFKKYDESALKVAVVCVPADGQIKYSYATVDDVAYIIYYSLIKDHINNNKINYTNFDCNKVNGTYIMQTAVK